MAYLWIALAAWHGFAAWRMVRMAAGLGTAVVMAWSLLTLNDRKRELAVSLALFVGASHIVYVIRRLSQGHFGFVTAQFIAPLLLCASTFDRVQGRSHA
jgi:hypothetical protein